MDEQTESPPGAIPLAESAPCEIPQVAVDAVCPVEDAPPRREPDLTLRFCTEKRAGRGEDGEPVLAVGPRAKGGCSFFMAVMDGMGGAGAGIISTDDGDQSEARLAAKAISGRFQKAVKEHSPHGSGWVGRTIDMIVVGTLKTLLQKYPDAPSGKLRGKIMRRFPSTVAATWMDDFDDLLHVAWAGDSRAYCLTPAEGLRQLTRDHARDGADDPFDGLRVDSPMSNLCCAGQPTALETRTYPIPAAPALIFCATDGCFGYLPSPMHFEALLLDTMDKASDMAGWRDALSAEIDAIAGDDASMAMLATVPSPETFETLREAFAERRAALGAQLESVGLLEESARHDALKAWWEQHYKPVYCAFAAQETQETQATP